jgi:hypothetical protein
MKKLAFPILVFAIAGLASLFIPDAGRSMVSVFLEFDQFRLFLMIAAFTVPAVMCVLALTQPVVKSWQPMAALAGFAIATVKSEVWSMASHLPSLPLAHKIMFVAIVGGAVCSILAVAKTEEDAANAS